MLLWGAGVSPKLWHSQCPKLLPYVRRDDPGLHPSPTQSFKPPPRWSSSGWTKLNTSLLPPSKVCTANPFTATFHSQHCLHSTGLEEQGPPITLVLGFLCSAGIRFDQAAQGGSSPSSQRPNYILMASHTSLQHNSDPSGSKISILWEQFLCELNASHSSCLQVPPEASILHTSLENT